MFKSSAKRTEECSHLFLIFLALWRMRQRRKTLFERSRQIALQVLADMIESGEDVPAPLKVLFSPRERLERNQGEARPRSSAPAGMVAEEQVGSHLKLKCAGRPNFTFCFHDSEEVGPAG